jgi:5S rRNA maturation endonuclease (ribonuclease M5)
LKIDGLLSVLGLEFNKRGRYYIGTCPIHMGDNTTALNLYPEGYKMNGYWRCNTKHCEKHFAQNIIGFTRGVLSNRRCRWTSSGGQKYSFVKTVQFLLDFIGDELSIDYSAIDRKRFISEVETITKTASVQSKGIHRLTVRKALKIPAEYYIKRGYSTDVLDRYDVGLCDKEGKEMFNRIVVPVYDNKLMMVGCQGRSIHKECPECEYHHPSGWACPETREEKINCAKWKNSNNFNVGQHLYNFWNAKPFIEDSKTVIVVEGPGDVWRLEEAGIHNSVAMFGTAFTEQQEILLETSGATSIIIMTDNDEAGEEAEKRIRKKCQRLYNLSRPRFDKHDVGEMSITEIRNELLPIFKAAERRF